MHGDTFEEKARNWFKGLFGDTNEKKLKMLEAKMAKANSFAAEFEKLSDDELKAKTVKFRNIINDALKNVPNRELIPPDAPKMPGQLRTEHERILAEVLDEILPEAFATVREASKRVLGMRHFDVQLVGGAALHYNKIAEMRTGEGKTLVATAPAYLNGLTGRGVHIVTVNDYLARRDSEWMGKVYKWLGLTVGLVYSHQPEDEKVAAYKADITYGTNHEFGFDYLRDNMRTSLDALVQRPYYMAIVDEVDNILIDEARTPLIISGFPTESFVDIYKTMAQVAPYLNRGQSKDDEQCDYWVDEKTRNVLLTEQGHLNAEKILGVPDLYDVRWNLAHHLSQALRAKELYKRDTDYVVRPNDENGKPEITIVDEFTGRMMIGRRWSDGLHQAIEAKEGVPIQEETLTYASITYQNLFRLYPKLAGMTGTAMTEANEFHKIYNLEVVAIPTNKTSIRTDMPDVVYKTEKQKYYAVVEEIVDMHEKGRPVLVGTTSIEKSELVADLMATPQKMNEYLTRRIKKVIDEIKHKKLTGASVDALMKVFERPGLIDPEKLLKAIDEFDKEFPKQNDLADYMYSVHTTAKVVAAIRKGIPFQVLNAKHHEKEAMIVAQAGRKGGVTIATNMAGRGTDILLGGNPEYIAKDKLRKDGVEIHDEVYEEKVSELTKKYKAETDKEHEEVVDCGGLHIIGTERHEARRIDNQLRGRAGRQGDPGSSRFFLSLEDSLMKIFGGEKIAKMMDWMQADEEIPIEHDMVTRSIANAQKKVEAHHFDVRKHVLQYDDVLNTQREVIYRERRRILERKEFKEEMLGLLDEHVEIVIGQHIDPESPPESWEEENLPQVLQVLQSDIPMLSDLRLKELEGLSYVELVDKLKEAARLAYQVREEHVGSEVMRELEKQILLRTIDTKWIDHLHNIDLVREGIHLRGYGQRDPLQEYKKEAFGMFDQLLAAIRQESVQLLFHVQAVQEPQMDMSELEHLLASGDLDAIAQHLAGSEEELAELTRQLEEAERLNQLELEGEVISSDAEESSDSAPTPSSGGAGSSSGSSASDSGASDSGSGSGSRPDSGGVAHQANTTAPIPHTPSQSPTPGAPSASAAQTTIVAGQATATATSVQTAPAQVTATQVAQPETEVSKFMSDLAKDSELKDDSQTSSNNGTAVADSDKKDS